MNFLGLLGSVMALGSVKDCSNGASVCKITSMSFSPDPPIKGQNSTLNLSLNVPSDIMGGTAIYSFKYNFIPITPEVKDLCGEVPGGCPIKAGPLNVMASYPIDTTLSGTITAQIQWKDIANIELLCVSVTMKV